MLLRKGQCVFQVSGLATDFDGDINVKVDVLSVFEDEVIELVLVL